MVLRSAFPHLEPPKTQSSVLHKTTLLARLQRFPHSLRNWSSKTVPDPSVVLVLILSSVLEDARNSELIGWSEDGSSFIIHNWKDFKEKVLPRICSHKTNQNFISLVWRYNFEVGQPSRKAACSNTEVKEYSICQFRCGDKDSILLVQA